MSRVQSSSSASTVGIKDTAGNPLTSTDGALDVNAVIGPSGFDILTPGYPTQVSVGTSSIPLLIANTNRKYAHIANNSGESIFIQYSSQAALNQGVRIPPRGFYTLGSNNLWLGDVNAIGVMSNQLIDVLEGE